ncbi:homing endonuclease [Vibrio phage MZH0603]|nr:homing endonuclease [Vibrio phage MZH0603]
MTHENNDTFNQLSLLSDNDLITVYATSAKVLQERGLLATCKKELKRMVQSRKTQEYKTPLFDRGKVKRMSNHSVLIDFLEEDWSYLFDGAYDEAEDYYVYYHTDCRKPNMRFRKGDKSVTFTGRPFYIGKGKGQRYKSKNRSRSHLSIINNITSTGMDDDSIYHIYQSGLNEKQALELEAKLITFFGCSSELCRNRAHFHGMKGGLLINNDPAKRPDDVTRMMKIKGGEY